MPKQEEASTVCEYTFCKSLQQTEQSSLPCIGCFAAQQSPKAAKLNAWVRVVGIVKYDGKSFAICQEYDGSGMIVVLEGIDFKPQFLLEVLMAFSDAQYRGSHDMWINARYRLFRFRYATWKVAAIEEVGPMAGPFYESMKEAFLRMGYPHVGTALVECLDVINKGFAAKSGEVLIEEAKTFLRM
mmetsp:Transcript_19200/g.45244  ORF Transcript_19200/g.45244 Transcript_19200/m.45244 type:complete len:185 (-) Transcript_19200:57-611(-)